MVMDLAWSVGDVAPTYSVAIEAFP